MQVSIIKYNAGNIRSVLFALERMGVEAVVTDDHDTIRAASHVIFPGVGAANSAMPYIKSHGLDTLITSLTQPFLGICLGMQLMCAHSEEGDTPCLGIFDIAVRKFPEQVNGQKLKVPHMGWNSLHHLKSPLLSGVKEESYCYFVHSYYVVPQRKEDIAGSTEYGDWFTSAVARDNIFATQFHPEKSAEYGLKLYKNFVSWQP